LTPLLLLHPFAHVFSSIISILSIPKLLVQPRRLKETRGLSLFFPGQCVSKCVESLEGTILDSQALICDQSYSKPCFETSSTVYIFCILFVTHHLLSFDSNTPDKELSENKEKGETDNSVNFETGHGPVEFFFSKAMILHTTCQNKVRARWFSIDDGTMQSLWGNVQVAIQFCIYPDVA
jgi:hypothetical protein